MLLPPLLLLNALLPPEDERLLAEGELPLLDDPRAAGWELALREDGRDPTFPVDGRAPTLPVEGRDPMFPVDGLAPPEPREP